MRHRIVLGGEEYLPFAESRMTALSAKGLSHASQTFLAGNVRIKIEVHGEHEFITISGGVHKYEFFCSDPGVVPVNGIPHNALLYTDSDPNNAADYAIAGCGVQLSGPKPLFSNVTTPTTGGKQWSMIPLPKGAWSDGIPEQVRFVTANDYAPGTGDAWQNQKYAEYIWRLDNSNKVMVTSCLGVGLGQSFFSDKNWMCATRMQKAQLVGSGFVAGFTVAYSAGLWFSSYPVAGYPNGRISGIHEMPDAWDVRPSMFTKSVRYEAGYKRAPLSNWRRACVQKKTIDGVDHYYIISSDKHGQFSAYYAKDYGVDYADIPSGAVQVVNPAYPGWVSQPADGDEAHDHWVFTFNKDGTRAASTPFERVAAYVWMGSEDLAGGALPAHPVRTSLLGDGGPAPSYPATGLLWPIEASLPGGTVVEYKVQRERVYRKATSLGTGMNGVYVQGRFYNIHLGQTSADGGSGIVLNAANDDTGYVPAFICKPGFIELELTITPSLTDPTSFTFGVTVAQSEAWSANKRYFVDCGYYAPDARTLNSGGPAEDTLLTAEIEAAILEPDKAVGVHDALNPDGSVIVTRVAYHSNRSTPVNFADTYNSTKADEPNCEGSLVSGYRGDLEVYYVVRERTTQLEVKRFNLAHRITWYGNFIDTLGSSNSLAAGPAHVGAIAYANLRTLDFLTRSFSLRTGVFATSGSARTPAQLWELGPRYELRMQGEDMRTISYADQNVQGYDEVPDPMVAHAAIPAEYTKLPIAYTAATGSNKYATGVPDSFLLAIQSWAQGCLIEPCVTRSINTHPGGDWATYINTRGEGRTFNAAGSTEANEVFDVIAPIGGAPTTHRTAFNAAFSQARSYASYQADGEAGGFCTFGIWHGDIKE